jgi:hypothetical protein
LLRALVVVLSVALTFGSQVVAISSASAAEAIADPGSPWIQSDKADYGPGSPVHLDGGNWQPGESVHIYVNDDQGRTWERNADVLADDAGVITDDFTLPDWFVATYHVLATGEVSGTAETSFTDGNVKLSVSPSGAATVSYTAYGAANCTGSVKSTGSTSTTDTLGVGSSESVRYDAAASNANVTFTGWTAESGLSFTQVAGSGGLSICVSGNFSGSKDLTANYLVTTGQATISGTVRNAATNLAIANATVTCILGCTTQQTATTNSSGQYTFNPISFPGSGPVTLTLRASAPGFTSKDQQVTNVRNNDTITNLPGITNFLLTGNSAPSAAAQSVTTNEDTGRVITLSGSDADGNNLTFAIVSGPSHGSLSPLGAPSCSTSAGTSTCTSNVSYAPTGNYNGSDSFTFKVNDGALDSSNATVSITVAPVNDVPTADTKAATVTRNSSANPITLSGSDQETPSGSLTFTVTGGGPTHGTLAGTGANRTYTPTAGYTGDDSFTYTVTDRGDPDNCSPVGTSCAAAQTSAPATFTIHVTAVATTTTASAATATYGDGTVNLAAHVASSSPVGTGSVTFTVRRADSSIVGSATTDATVVNGDASVSYSLPAGTPAGSYTIRADYNGVALGDSAGTASLTVDPATLSVNAQDQSKVYGDGDPAAVPELSGFVNGENSSSASVTGTAACTTGSHAEDFGSYADVYSCGRGTLAAPNYVFVAGAKGKLTITKRAVEVTADPQSKTYGDDDPALTYDVTSGSLAQGDAFSGELAREAGENVGDYDITQGTLALSDNYTLTFKSAKLSIGTRQLQITADDASKTYGDTLTFNGSEFHTSPNALVTGDSVTSVTLSSDGAAGSATVGPYKIVASAAVGSGLTNYDIQYVDGTLTVGQRTLTVTADDQSKTYGNTFTFDGDEFKTGSGELVNGDTVNTVTLASAGTAATALVGDYSITPSAAQGSGLGNYKIAYVVGKLTVGKRDLTVTADNQSKTYGDAFPFTGHEFHTGAAELVNGDSVSSVTLSSDGAPVTAGVAGSPYDITPSAAVGSGLGNYKIAYVVGKLTVGKRDLTVTADDQSKTYGDPFTFDGDEFTTGDDELVNGDSVTSVTLSSAGAAGTALVAGSPYDITPSAAVGSGWRTTTCTTSRASSPWDCGR